MSKPRRKSERIDAMKNLVYEMDDMKDSQVIAELRSLIKEEKLVMEWANMKASSAEDSQYAANMLKAAASSEEAISYLLDAIELMEKGQPDDAAVMIMQASQSKKRKAGNVDMLSLYFRYLAMNDDGFIEFLNKRRFPRPMVRDFVTETDNMINKISGVSNRPEDY